LMRTSPIPSMSWSALRVRARSLRLLSILARSRRADRSLRKAIGTPDAGPDSGAAGTAHGFLRLLAQCNRLHCVHAVWLPIGRGRIRSGLDLEPLRLTRGWPAAIGLILRGHAKSVPRIHKLARPIERNPSKESAAIPSSTPPSAPPVSRGPANNERLQREQSCGTSAGRHTIFAVGTERLRSVTEGSHYPGKAIRVPTD
jgi:hypothetical protein